MGRTLDYLLAGGLVNLGLRALDSTKLFGQPLAGDDPDAKWSDECKPRGTEQQKAVQRRLLQERMDFAAESRRQTEFASRLADLMVQEHNRPEGMNSPRGRLMCRWWRLSEIAEGLGIQPAHYMPRLKDGSVGGTIRIISSALDRLEATLRERWAQTHPDERWPDDPRE